MGNESSQDKYLIRVCGRVQGPLSVEQIRKLVVNGTFGRLHEASLDGETWLAADQFNQFFDAANGVTDVGWYYSKDGAEVGPVSRSELERLANDGRINADDFVWSDGMLNWTLARDIPGLLPRSSSATKGSHVASTAVAGLVLGLIGWTLPVLGGLLAVAFSHSALRRIGASQGAITGSGMAIVGLTLGYIHLALIAVALIILLLQTAPNN